MKVVEPMPELDRLNGSPKPVQHVEQPRVSVCFGSEFPLLERPWFVETLKRFESVFPHWLREVTLFFKENGSDSDYLNVHVEPAYHRMAINVFPSFLTNGEHHDDAEKQRAILHEVCHAYNAYLCELALDCMASFFEEETPGTKIARKMLTEERERCNDALAMTMWRILHKEKA